MGNTSMKAQSYKQGSCTRKHGRRRAFRHHHSKRRHRGGLGSPLNPSASASSSSSKRKTKRKVEPSLHKLVLRSEAYKSRPAGPPKKPRKSPPRSRTPVKRNFVISEEVIMEEEEEKPRRRSL